MKRDFLIIMFLLVCAISTRAWGNCPDDSLISLDRGNCDTMYIEPWSDDIADSVWTRPGPYYVRVPIYITTDVPVAIDSIAGFVIPLCYTHSNPTKFCSLTAYQNQVLWGTSARLRSIFRHLPDNTTATVHNWMMDLWEAELGEEWNGVTLDLDGTSHFWLVMIPTGSEDKRFGSGSKILLFTMTLKLEDTMSVCIDTCYWPPSSVLAWTTTRDDLTTTTKIPRSGTGTSSFEVCFPPRDTSDVKEIEGDNIKPSDFSLSQNYPNPFNPTTNFQFTLPKSSHVKIEIFNIVGQKVAILVDGDMKPGLYTADWNGRDENGKTVSSGIYFYRMQADDFSDMKKMVLVK
jgi:hypothetical protein